MSRTPEYKAWQAMIVRCHVPGSQNYRNYGARGIRVDSEWRRSFVAFYEHVGPRPSTKHSIDRIDNDGNYEPGNVRWATVAQQKDNTRIAKLLTFQGKTMSIGKWARALGVSDQTLRSRIGKLGWSVEEALSTPADEQPQTLITLRGETKPLSEWCRIAGLNCATVRARLSSGWTVERALTVEAKSICGNQKLTPHQACRINEKVIAGESPKSVAAEFGVGECHVYRIASGTRMARHTSKLGLQAQ